MGSDTNIQMSCLPKQHTAVKNTEDFSKPPEGSLPISHEEPWKKYS